MVKQGAQVDPDAARFEHIVDCLDEGDDVVGAVDEETGRHAVPGVGLVVYLGMRVRNEIRNISV